MKKLLFVLLFVSQLLFASLYDKSALLYYGRDISYTTAGVHDYIIVQPELTDTATPGFSIYRDKIYAYVSIGEIDKRLKEYRFVKKEWIVAKNKFWNSEVFDIKNKEYQEFVFQKMIEPRMKEGFKNFFFDTLDSYQIYSKDMKQRKENEEALADFINTFHKRYPDAKLVVNRGFEIIDKIHNSIEAVLFESYYKGIGTKKNQPYRDISDQDRAWFDIWIAKIQKYKLDIISVEYMPEEKIYSDASKPIINKIKAKGMIPFISTSDLCIYGKSSKNALKREIFTLIDEKKLDRSFLDAHRYGALPLEYLGYKQKLHDINKGLPSLSQMRHYGGVMIWLEGDAQQSDKLTEWIEMLIKHHIKVLFVGNFGFDVTKQKSFLDFLGLTIEKTEATKRAVAYQQADLVGYEITPPLYTAPFRINVSHAEAVLTYRYSDATTSTPVALTKWGAYIVDDGMMATIDDKHLWIVNPFKFFQQALRLESMPVADVTTKNGKRILFSHVNGDGFATHVEGDFATYSADAILNNILKVYKLPHSVAVTDSFFDTNSSNKAKYNALLDTMRTIYKLPNVEGAISTNGDPLFCQKVQNSAFGSQYHKKLLHTFKEVNQKLYPQTKEPKVGTLFWSSECIPGVDMLRFASKNRLLAINGGETSITKTRPWLEYISPLGIERKAFAQVYAGIQNENSYTNDWLGPFWAYKKVVQSFEMTNRPKRLKPIDIYYHFYSGSKQASLDALKYVFDWAKKQDVIPLFTSEYIPRVLEFYNYAVVKGEANTWRFSGLDKLDTLRVDEKDTFIDFQKSPTVTGMSSFENHSYFSLQAAKSFVVKFTKKQENAQNYLIASNAYAIKSLQAKKRVTYSYKSYTPLTVTLHLAPKTDISISPKPQKFIRKGQKVFISYKNQKEAQICLSW